MPLCRCLGGGTDGQTPKALTAPRHRAAQEQEQGQHRRQQPHPGRPPRAWPGLLYSQPRAPGGISQSPSAAGKRRRGGKRGQPHASTSALSLPPPLHVARAASPPKKAENAVASSSNFPCFLAKGWCPPPCLPPQAPQAPGMPYERKQGTVTEGCHLYWACWVVPKRHAQRMAMGWERLEEGMGIFNGLKA